MRMRKKPNLDNRMERCENVWLKEPETLCGNWKQLKPDAEEIWVEVGCGKGKFTAELAKNKPNILLIAMEKVPDALVMAMEKAVAEELKNVFFIADDVTKIDALFAENEVDRLYINFCDPWPKKKEAKRRLTYRDFLEKYKKVLKPNAVIEFKTDNRPLFDFSLEEFAMCRFELRNVSYHLHEKGPVGIMTGYEERFYQLGTPINRCEAVLTDKTPYDGYGIPKKIKMKTPLVEMDGDEMTRIIWRKIKQELIEPFVELKTEYYDLGLPERERTKDQITLDAARAIAKYGVGVKCATITPNEQRMKEYQLSQQWKSPNGTIRTELDGTVFRTPILINGISPFVKCWKKPITLARHAYGDVYKAAEMRVPEGKAELVFVGKDGTEQRKTIYDFECPGVLTGQYNKDTSIASFARSCFNYALENRQDLWFSAKDTIAKIYDGRFKQVFEEIYEKEYRTRFEDAGIVYFYTLIDDAVARVIRSEGGFIWACKNYDGDVMSDMVSTAFGSLAMMTSVLVSPDGKYEYEAAHGTVTRHYYRYLKGEKTSTNPMATIFAWTGALRKRGELDAQESLMRFADRLEAACIATIESGIMTGDLASLWEKGDVRIVTTEEFLQSIRERITENEKK